MKIALCLQGLSSGWNDKGNEVNFTKSYDYLKQNILDKNDVDIFIHTWNDDTDKMDEIKKIYNPVSSIFEKQIIFAEPIAPKGALSNETNKVHSIKSRWYSHMKSVELKQKYEIENNITYDFVLVSRFDNCFLAPFEFSTYESDCFYSASWEHPHCVTGFLDYWFLADSKTMDKFSDLYNRVDDYIKETGEESNHILSKHHANKLNLKLGFIKKEQFDFKLEREMW